MMLAFFGFLRVSEYTAMRTQSFDPESTLCFNDITVNHLIHVKIKSSKTDPFRCGVDIRLAQWFFFMSSGGSQAIYGHPSNTVRTIVYIPEW